MTARSPLDVELERLPSCWRELLLGTASPEEAVREASGANVAVVPSNARDTARDTARGATKFAALSQFLESETRLTNIFPAPSLWLRALREVPREQVRVVLLGQDPYHGVGQAIGLSFAVPKSLRVKPPSLKNILKELHADLGLDSKKALADFTQDFDCELEGWTKQGVLLLNTVLTVRENVAASHQDKGWEELTDTVISAINQNATPTVFWLWGSFAQKKRALITNPRHLILESAHPSPLSAYRGFFGSRPFSKTNAFFEQHRLPPIQWV